jgi:GntR family transcriptional regulator, transcriptional repressor for pyruvate dehydrogenase complex
MAPSVVDVCARALRESILTGALPPGVRLPTERTLAEQFGVNRATVRGALGQLETEHLVSARQGSGYTVHDFRREAGPELIATLAELAEGSDDEVARLVGDLLHVRRSLARAVLEKLAEGARDADLDAVEVALARFEEAVAKSPPASELARADLDVVAALVAATRSTVLQLCLNPVASLLARLPRLQDAMYEDPEGNVLAFRAVVAWVRSGRGRGLDALLAMLAERDDATLLALQKSSKKKKQSRR